MKRFALLLAVATCFCSSAFAAQIQWTENYQEALNESKASSKPIFLFFTGTGWCTWCTKLEKESLHTKTFVDATKDKLIFVKLDFPMNGKQDSATKQQNERLRKEYNVRGYPSVILIDSNENILGITGYLPGGGKQYADHILKKINR